MTAPGFVPRTNKDVMDRLLKLEKSFRNVQQNIAGATTANGGAQPASTTPLPIGAAVSGSAATVSRSDHVHSGALANLSDTAITTPTVNQTLAYNGSAWANTALAGSNLGYWTAAGTGGGASLVSTGATKLAFPTNAYGTSNVGVSASGTGNTVFTISHAAVWIISVNVWLPLTASSAVTIWLGDSSTGATIYGIDTAPSITTFNTGATVTCAFYVTSGTSFSVWGRTATALAVANSANTAVQFVAFN